MAFTYGSASQTYSGSGSTYNGAESIITLSVFDAIAISESVSGFMDVENLSVFESISTTEFEQTALDVLVPSVFDSISIAEVVSADENIDAVVFDAITTTEVVTLLLSALYATTEDNVSILDEPVIYLDVLNVSESDTSLIVEVVGVLDFPLYIGPFFESITITEVITAYPDLQEINVSDAITITENLAKYIDQLFAFGSDDIQYGEPIFVEPDVLNYSVFDSISITENNSQFIGALFASVEDDIATTENVSVFTDILYASVDDTITIAENTSQFLNVLNTSVDDTISTAEHVTIFLNVLNLSVNDAITITEVVTVFLNVLNLSVNDVTSITEVVGALDFPLFIGPVFDSISTTENLSIFLNVLNVSVNDSITTSEFFYGLETRSRLPYDCQSCAWTDGTNYWRAWFNAPAGYIQVDWTTNPAGAWTENVNARISDAGVGNDFSIHGDATDVAIIYSRAGNVDFRISHIYNTTFSWASDINLFTSGTPAGATYSRPSIIHTASSHWMVAATQLNAGTQTLQSRLSTVTNPANAGQFGAAVNINAGTASQVYSSLASLNVSDDCLVLYAEGTSISLKRFNSTVWDASPTAVATTKPNPNNATPTQFECWGDTVNNKVHIDYIKSDGTVGDRDYTTAGGLTAEGILDSSTDTEHVSIGAFGNAFVMYSWTRPVGSFDGSQKYMIEERLSNGQMSNIIQIGPTSASHIVGADMGKSDTAALSGFIVWEENSGIFADTFGIGLTVNDTITITEVLTNIRLSALFASAFDTITITEAVTLFLNLLFTGTVFDSISITENVSISPNPLITGTVFDSITITENETTSLNVLVPDVFDSITINENETTLLTTLVPSVFDAIAITENLTIFLNALFVSVDDTVTITENTNQFLDVLVPNVFDAITITENTSQFIDQLFFSVDESVFIFDLAPLNPDELFATIFDAISITESVSDVEDFLFISLTDNITITENETTLIPILVPSVFDNATITEVLQINPDQLFISTTDGFEIFENFQASPDQLFAFADQIVSVTDQATLNLNILAIDVSDSILITEVAGLLDFPLYVGPVEDTITIAETPILALDVLFESLIESVTILDVYTPELRSYINVTDAGQVHSYIGSAVTYSDPTVTYDGLSPTDINIVEYAQADVVIGISVSDSITITEDVTNALDVLYLSVEDDITVNETVDTNIPFIAFSVEDDITITETVTDETFVQVDSFETITIVENAQLELDQLFIDVSEDISLTDFPQLSVNEEIHAEENISIDDSNVNLTVPLRFTVFELDSIIEQVILDMSIGILAQDLITIAEFFTYTEIFGMQASDDITITENFDYTEEFGMFASDEIIVNEAATQEVPDEGIVFDDITSTEFIDISITALEIANLIDNIFMDDTFFRGHLIIVKGVRRMRVRSNIPNPKFKVQSKIDYFTHVQEVGV